MRAATVLGLAAAATAQQTAPVVNGNPTDVAYRATLPDTTYFTGAALDNSVQGYITAVAPANGIGVQFSVHLQNFPASGGPFLYHIHVEPVVNGNCNGTLGHLDPYNRGEVPACNASAPATCQVGDLSGKHGKITSNPFNANYADPYVSLIEGSPAFMGNRSFVVHYSNKTRITRANFVRIDASAVNSTNTTANSSASSNISAPTYTAVSPQSSGAANASGAAPTTAATTTQGSTASGVVPGTGSTAASSGAGATGETTPAAAAASQNPAPVTAAAPRNPLSLPLALAFAAVILFAS